jgi:hypothetical protein
MEGLDHKDNEIEDTIDIDKFRNELKLSRNKEDEDI